MGETSINIGGYTLKFDPSEAKFIIGEKRSGHQELSRVNVDISETALNHDVMTYTTDIDTVSLIFENMTFRSSSLTNENLNDPVEKERIGITEYAHSRFITCFCHSSQEIIPFWMYYGKSVQENKIMLQFKNFAPKIEECFFTDYALVAGGKKCYFKSTEYGNAINHRTACAIAGFDYNEDYDLRTCIDTLSIFDVEYVPIDSSVFSDDNSGEVSVDFEKVTKHNNSTVIMQGFDTTVLGKHKSDSWEYEKETRILCVLSNPSFSEWDYIDLRLKPELFRDLKIILSPWDDGKLYSAVSDIINKSSLPEEIKNSITIVDSGLKGNINIHN